MVVGISPKRKKSRIGIFWLPSLITCCSLVIAMYAVTLGIEGKFLVACMLLAVSATLDVLDGLIARLTNSTSNFGAQLDSLADMVAFGASPAILAWLWGYQWLSTPMTIATGLFAITAALRLARFNTQIQDKEKKPYFQGLPSTAAASLVFSTIWLAETLSIEGFYMSAFLAFTCVVGGGLMVSNIRYICINNLAGRRIPFIGLFALLIGLLLLVSQPALFVFGSIWSYIIFGILYTLFLRRQRRIKKNLKQSASIL